MSRLLLTLCFTLIVTVIFQDSPLCNENSKHQRPAKQITISVISNLYQPVSFNHQLHRDYAACSECHHHTTGCLPSRPYCAACHTTGATVDSVACHSCHPAKKNGKQLTDQQQHEQVYHIDIPGLIGAYHLLCIDCHEGIGTGPVDCGGCHVMVKKGQQFFYTEKANALLTTSQNSPEMTRE